MQNTTLTKTIKSFKKAFITGADSNTEWMLPWFFENYKKHNKTPILLADFGLKNPKKYKKYVHAIIDMSHIQEEGWFKKPKAIIYSPAEMTVWIDTDCEVLKPIDDIFDRLEPNKLNMVKDKPWSKRFGMEMYNSGIVGVIKKPNILYDWAKQVQENPARGDQETLAQMLNDPLKTLTYINPIPNEYNWLRVQVANDGQNSPHKKVMHWTGAKGKDKIKEKMRA